MIRLAFDTCFYHYRQRPVSKRPLFFLTYLVYNLKECAFKGSVVCSTESVSGHWLGYAFVIYRRSKPSSVSYCII